MNNPHPPSNLDAQVAFPIHPAPIHQANEDAFDELVAVIEASQGILSILIAVCDDRLFRDQIIQRYETALSPPFFPVRLVLDHQEPSLRAAIDQWLTAHSGIQTEPRPLMLTLTGSEALMWLNLESEDEPTPLDKFYGYLQWTREGLREFPYPIVLWVTHRILKQLSRRSPDFWSWRRGVYRFMTEESQVMPQIPLPKDSFPTIDSQTIDSEAPDSLNLPLADLLGLIAKTEAKSNIPTAALAALYDQLGQAYARRVNNGEATDLHWEKTQAIASFRRAIELQAQFNLASERMNSLRRLGAFYRSQSNYPSALEYYQQSLEVARAIGDVHGEGTTLMNLGVVYKDQGKWNEAIAIYEQSLQIYRAIGDVHGEGQTLNNLGTVYQAQGKWTEAIAAYEQSLQIYRAIGDVHGEGQTLGNLGMLQKQQKNLDRAKEIWGEALTKLHPDSPEHATVTQWLHSAAQPRRGGWQSWLLPLGLLGFLLWNLVRGHWLLALLVGGLGMGWWVWRRRR
ncbi:MAG: tetratricopeptide repeat protein [Oculatellaceae cyanobacterium Prado106]|jgi:tetratricopeptide (TPR) repeat protein|nr:tetratricopeptide repeat protein [Oculatellaceae cyanobacterium Prado106]